MQKGEYDLDLRRRPVRAAWARVLRELDRVKAKPRRQKQGQCDGKAGRRTRPGALVAPISVVIPVRDRGGPRLANALNSLRWQSAGIPREVLVVSSGSQPRTNEELERLCADASASLVVFGNPREPWCKPRALNVGIRLTDGDAPFLMTMDADIILATNFLEVTLTALKQEPDSMVLCQTSDLPQSVALGSAPGSFLASFERLRRRARLRGTFGTGGIQAAKREFFLTVGGYDEDLSWWGAEDGDMVHRARLIRFGEVKLQLQHRRLLQFQAFFML